MHVTFQENVSNNNFDGHQKIHFFFLSRWQLDKWGCRVIGADRTQGRATMTPSYPSVSCCNIFLKQLSHERVCRTTFCATSNTSSSDVISVTNCLPSQRKVVDSEHVSFLDMPSAGQNNTGNIRVWQSIYVCSIGSSKQDFLFNHCREPLN